MPKRKLDTLKGYHVSNKRTICEVHREIYDILVLELAESNNELFEKIANLLEEAFVMGIKLVERLIAYKIDDLWDKEVENKEEIGKLRQERVRLLKVINESMYSI